MLIKEFKNKKYAKVELRQGCTGSGKTNYHVQTERKGSEGQTINWVETFTSQKEAENWIKHL